MNGYLSFCSRNYRFCSMSFFVFPHLSLILFPLFQHLRQLSTIFSLRYLQNEADIPVGVPDSNMILSPHMLTSTAKTSTTKTTPKSGLVKQRSNSLSEINDNKIFNIGVKELSLNKVKLPSLDHLRPLQKRKVFKNTSSLDNREFNPRLTT
jgi:hypothetical protein